MIEFVKGEQYCRWNGVLMTPEKEAELTGITGAMLVYNDKIIIYGGVYYTDLDIGTVLRVTGTEVEGERADDPCLAERDVFAPETGPDLRGDAATRKIVADTAWTDGWRMKPYADFAKDWPAFKPDVYADYHEELDNFLIETMNHTINPELDEDGR